MHIKGRQEEDKGIGTFRRCTFQPKASPQTGDPTQAAPRSHPAQGRTCRCLETKSFFSAPHTGHCQSAGSCCTWGSKAGWGRQGARRASAPGEDGGTRQTCTPWLPDVGQLLPQRPAAITPSRHKPDVFSGGIREAVAGALRSHSSSPFPPGTVCRAPQGTRGHRAWVNTRSRSPAV